MSKNQSLSELEILISKNIQALLDERKHKPTHLAAEISRRLNLPHPNTLSKLVSYLKNEVRWTNEFLNVIAEIYSVSLDTLFGRNFIVSSPLLHLKEEGIPYGVNSNRIKTVKVYGKIAAGIPVDIWNHEDFSIEISHPKINKLNDTILGFLVKGESMLEKYKEGDIVVTTQLDFPSTKPRNKELVVTMFSSDPDSSVANLKEINWVNKDKDQFILKSFNPHYDATYHTLKQVRKMFRVHLGITT